MKISDLLDEGPEIPEHEHVVNEHSVVKWNGGDPVWLCGYMNGECRIITRYAYKEETDGQWKVGGMYP